ncbi:MAG TPA: hypothetical protein VGC81_14915 [Candidatus Methylomirabilis sp.]|jgi:hypothetical protein
MTQRCSWLTLLGVVLSITVLLLSLGHASAADTRGIPPAAQAKRSVPTVSLVGTIVAVVPESQTILVDVRVSADVLRVGAVVTPQTKIEANGNPAAFEDLEAGSRVRLTFRRIATGNEAISVQILPGRRG